MDNLCFCEDDEVVEGGTGGKGGGSFEGIGGGGKLASRVLGNLFPFSFESTSG